jgi:hypothetical protein
MPPPVLLPNADVVLFVLLPKPPNPVLALVLLLVVEEPKRPPPVLVGVEPNAGLAPKPPAVFVDPKPPKMLLVMSMSIELRALDSSLNGR